MSAAFRAEKLAADPAVLERSGEAVASWELAREYGLDDVDGTRPDWGAHAIAAGLME